MAISRPCSTWWRSGFRPWASTSSTSSAGACDRCGGRRPRLRSALVCCGSTSGWATLFLDEFSNPALSEESFKGLQIVAMVLLGRALSPSIRHRLGINTPIQGALWGAAVGAGFNLIETFDYVGRTLDVTVPSPVAAFVQLLVRMLGQVSMHAAWTGITGYYIGLSVLTKRGGLGWLGLLLAAVLHAAWNTGAGALGGANSRLMVVVGAVSYVVFAASVLKGRQLASRIGSEMLSAPAPAPGVVVAPAAEPVAVDQATPAPVVPHVRTIAVRLGSASMRLRPGDTIRTAHAPGLQPSRGDDVVGEVVTNPSDPNVWGLRNLSLSTWAAGVGPGQDRQLEPGYTILLEPGIVVRLGDVTLEVEPVISAPGDRP
jgi:hypothetical protein